MNKKEYILCAAIWFPEYKTPTHGPKNIGNGVVMCGRRHPDIIGTHTSLTGTSLPAAHIQGFLTNKNRFVEREEAFRIASAAQQGKAAGIGLRDELYSEDLY